MEYNEILFWKVFHNKFIFNIIIEQISNDQLEYERIELYKIGNRIKFKDIQSLKLIVSKKQFELLKCKLEHNDFILYNRESIDQLIHYAPIEIIKLFIEKYKIKQQDPQLDKLNVMIDLVLHSIKNNNLECLRYFLIELQLPVERTAFEYTLKEKSIEFIDLILNSNQFKLEESTRKFCLKLISNNSRNFNDLIEYVIYKRPELNYFTTKSIVENFNQQKLSKYPGYLNTPQILDFFLFYKIKSKETKLKLLEMGCVSTVKPEFIYSNKLKPTNWKDYDEVEFYLFIILKLGELEKCIAKDTTLAIIRNEFEGIKDCSNLKTQDKCKKLHELIIIKLFPYFSSHIYRDYFELYDQPIPNSDFLFTFQITFSTFSVNGLNYLLDLKKKKKSIQTTTTTTTIYINEITKKIDTNNEKEVLEFLKIYFKSKHLLPELNKVSIDNMFLHVLNHCSIETLNEILKLKPSSQDDIIKGFLSGFLPDNNFQSSREKADEFIKTIHINKDNDRFIWFSEKLVKKLSSTAERNFINYKCLNYLNISTKNHVDFLIENKPETVIIPLVKKYFEIESLELINYFEKKLNQSKPSANHYYYLYFKSLFNGDFKTFQEIDDIKNLKLEFQSADFKSIKINDPLLIDKVIENINKSNLKSLTSDSKIKLFKFLLKQNDEKLQSKVIGSLQFNLFPLESMLVLLDNILDVNIEASNAIINNLVINGEFELSLLVLAVNQFEKSRLFIIYKSLDGKLIKNGYNAKDKLIPFIKSLFNKLEANLNDDFPSLSDSQEIQFIFSYLYKLLIQCDDITLDLINSVRQFYLSNDLIITDDLFSLSCYLSLRSYQFIKYLSAMKIRLNNGIFFLNGVWNFEFDSSDQNYTLDFNLMLKENKVPIDKDFFDVIYQTTKSKDNNFDFFKKIVFHKLRNLMIEFQRLPRPLPIAVEVNLFIELNRADLVLELAEIEVSLNKPFPIETVGGFMNIATLDQLKQLISLIGQTESKRIKYLFLKNSIISRKFDFIDYFLKESILFIEELTKGSLDSNEFKFFKEILASNDIELVEYLLKNYRGQDFQTIATTTTSITTTTTNPQSVVITGLIDLFKDFQYSQNLYHNNFQVTMDNGLIDMFNLLSRHFLFVPKKDNILHTIRQGRFKLVDYLYKNDYFEHLGEETITSINDFVKDQYPYDYFSLKKNK
ncbi:hypothetical protein DDB_G0274219 [Dictyostelium discoideum AX4]|uniref:Uncharacterized protein n=1 Tax=Dictyostelium discoideum TaxID=44689 RepID=Q8T2A2_DICDI|nr:hypothetical protein DDB_G0274219 [Dictyostelium discoideum AX4]EAL70002.1 hypothetical protein DDB_G0274219 [Dictyostelium discoideum AX4]|eukprot:XP_644252.1 hypothetical protein DDB_G0274219 [Dictyostelium discoideum AX4]